MRSRSEAATATSRGRLRRRRLAPALLAVLVAWPVLAACSGERNETDVAEDVAELPFVEDVVLGESNFEQDSPAVPTVVVVLDPEPTVEEVSEVLTTLADPGTEEPILTTAYVGTNAPYTTGPTAGVSAVRDVGSSNAEEAAEIFVAGLALADELGGDAATDVDYDPEFDNDDSGRSVSVLPASDARRDIDAAVEAVAADSVLRAADTLVVGQEIP